MGFRDSTTTSVVVGFSVVAAAAVVVFQEDVPLRPRLSPAAPPEGAQRKSGRLLRARDKATEAPHAGRGSARSGGSASCLSRPPLRRRLPRKSRKNAGAPKGAVEHAGLGH
jgi:hypothetical protein